MAKADKIEVKVFPPEATILFSGVVLHALVSSGCTWSKAEIAKYCFDLGEEVLKEARSRGWKTE